jgi:hypothetical protein
MTVAETAPSDAPRPPLSIAATTMTPTSTPVHSSGCRRTMAQANTGAANITVVRNTAAPLSRQ